MEYFLIEKYKICIKHLNNYDVVGINYCTTPPHYSGNFWWSTYNYYITLLDSIETEMLLFKNNPKFISLFQSGLEGYGHYYNSYPKSNYVNKIDNYTFIPKLDHMHDDIYFHKVSVKECMQIADKDPKCIGFNTLGFFKNKINIDTLVSSHYFGPNDGIYIKTEYFMKK